MTKISSYQKQKNKIAQLEHDIQCILGRKTFTEKVTVTEQYKMMYAAEDVMFSGTSQNLTFENTGIYPKIQQP